MSCISTQIILNRPNTSIGVPIRVAYSPPSISICNNKSPSHQAISPDFSLIQVSKVMFVSSSYPSTYFLINDSGVNPLGALSTEPSARCEPIPRLHKSISKLAVSATPGEKQAIIPSKSLGIRYPPSLAPPTRISSNLVFTGRNALTNSFN